MRKLPGTSNRAMAVSPTAMIAAAIGTLLLLSGCSEDLPPLVHRPAHAPAAILIKTVDVFDAKAPRIDRNKDVLIRDGIIDSIADGGALIAPTDAEVIDGTGLTLLPGLIDAHAHLDSSPYPPWQLTLPNPDANLQSLLYCGVTTILDPGESDAEAAVSRRKRVESGEQLGPQIFTAGRIITARGGHPVAMAKSLLPWWLAWYVVPRLAHEVDTDEGAREAARVIHASGADVVKIVVDSAPEGTPRISTAQIAAAAEEASNLGLRTITHIGTFEDARDAASGGSSMWVHGVYKEPLDDGQVAELAATGIPMTPTLEVFNSYSRTLDANRVATALESEIAPPGVLEALNDVPEDHPAIATFRPFIEMLARNRQAGADNARRLFEAGVTMLAGSDPQAGVFAGAGLHRELALLSRAGIPNEHVLAAATINAARYLTRSPDPDFGIVAPGKRADLLLVEGDPVADIANVSTIRAVILRGEVLKRQARR